MAVIVSRQRRDLRQSIGLAVGALYVSSATSEGTTNTLPDNTLLGGDGEHRGRWVVATSDANSGLIRRVTDYDADSTTLTVVAFPNIVPDEMTYELWDEDMPPARIHDFINRALMDVTRKGAVPVTDTTITASRDKFAYTLPSGIVGLRTVQHRVRVLDDGDSESWLFETLHPRFWSVDKDGRQLLLNADGRDMVGNERLRLIGLRKPAALEQDGDECEAEPEYVVNKALAMAYVARADRRSDRREAALQLAERHDAMAERVRTRAQTPSNMRWAD